MQTLLLYRLGSCRTENNLHYFCRRGPSYRCHPANMSRSGRAPPPKTERLGFPAHTSPEGRKGRPPARGAPPRQTRGVACPGAINLAEIRYLVQYRVPAWVIHREGGRSASGDKSIHIICIAVFSNERRNRKLPRKKTKRLQAAAAINGYFCEKGLPVFPLSVR